MIDVVHSEDFTFNIVLDYMDENLSRYLQGHQGPLAPELVKYLLQQFLNGIAYCHAHGIIHRDLKPQNFLMDHNNNLKISDFGTACNFNETRCSGSDLIQYGTIWYRAPEILLGSKEYTTAFDMWAIGCIFGELVAKQPLFTGDSDFLRLVNYLRNDGKKVFIRTR